MMRRYLLVLVAGICLSVTGSGQTGTPATAPPKLIVMIAIDQMRFDYLDRFAPLYTEQCSRMPSIVTRPQRPGLAIRFC
jgi:predicted AlkP superfamily pyrophosphatase or phosphodiesterase